MEEGNKSEGRFGRDSRRRRKRRQGGGEGHCVGSPSGKSTTEDVMGERYGLD